MFSFTVMMHFVFAKHQSSHCSYTAFFTAYQQFQFTSNHTIEHKAAKKHNNRLRKNEYTMDKGYNPTASAFRLCS
jgi:phosphoribosylformylglycinamidine (FGAM) synthase-like enzyme